MAEDVAAECYEKWVDEEDEEFPGSRDRDGTDYHGIGSCGVVHDVGTGISFLFGSGWFFKNK